ncbi:Rrf2 family transcriptional regulator [Adlercreutzia murintestinalis]|uniref:Rrf2 family transcriptional regulator n=1 Tax=Adlercreutzia murintestinalis TaxID=2941325 RepID=UPI00203BC04E|nr:Rrf2 family transcriptional regulator [Adlercreutzia murintestinalis]
MLLRASTDYGLRTLLYLAERGCVCSSKEISEKAGIPRDYLIQLAQQERQAGLIESRSGKNGGYIIAKPPAEITLLEVLNAINGDENSAARTRRDTPENAPALSNLFHVMDMVLSSYDAYLGSITLDMLMKCARDSVNAGHYLAECLNAASQQLIHPARTSA